MLFTNLDKILEQDKTATEIFDSSYWGNVFYSSLYVYFDSLRNVYRFSSTFSFHFSLLRGRRVFEANPVDLIAIECIRLFEPDVYKEMARSKRVLTKNGSDRYDGSDKSTPKLLENIIAKSTEGKNEYVKKLIELLFPTVQWALGGTHYGNDFSGRWLREVRICHPSNFDKYFQFSIPSGELSNSDLREMLALTSNTESLSSFILTLQERGILMNALSQFDAYTDKIPLENAESYIKALLDIGDRVDHESIGFTMSSSYTNVVRLVIWFLRRIESQEERGRLLLTCFQASNGIAVVERILQADESHRDSSEGDIVFADNEFFNLKKEFVRKLDEMADNSPDILMSHGHLVSFLFRWKHWGDKTKVCLWLQQQIATEKGCLQLLRAFVSKMSSQGDGDYTSKITSYIKLEDIENFVSIIKVQEKINGIDDESLDEKSKEAIEAFEKALDQRNKGLKDEW